ncbi:MAG: hypothetical protein LBH54_03205 [Clostridiales bacterium]|nr:hypothetical protein [Clostridiales bacterium]
MMKIRLYSVLLAAAVTLTHTPAVFGGAVAGYQSIVRTLYHDRASHFMNAWGIEHSDDSLMKVTGEKSLKTVTRENASGFELFIYIDANSRADLQYAVEHSQAALSFWIYTTAHSPAFYNVTVKTDGGDSAAYSYANQMKAEHLNTWQKIYIPLTAPASGTPNWRSVSSVLFELPWNAGVTTYFDQADLLTMDAPTVAPTLTAQDADGADTVIRKEVLRPTTRTLAVNFNATAVIDGATLNGNTVTLTDIATQLPIAFTGVLDAETNTYRVFLPENALQKQARYRLHLTDGVKNVLGVQLQSGAEFVFSVAASDGVSQPLYHWGNVSLGGGGYVTGLAVHADGAVYCRTDIGGAYRYLPDQNKWLPLMDGFPLKDANLYGVDGIALSPNDSNTVYIAAGKYTKEELIGWNAWTAGDPYPCDVLKSTDGGLTWARTGLDKDFSANGGNRMSGEPIAVDPNNAEIIYAASADGRLYKSENAAHSWQAVGTFPYTPSKTGRNIVFDGRQTLEGKTAVIYVGVKGAGVYQSTDAGGTWRLLAGSPASPNRICAASNGDILVAGETGIFRYRGENWSKLTDLSVMLPGSALSDTRFTGVDVHPENPDVIIAVFNSSKTGSVYENCVFYSTDGGAVWNNMTDAATRVHTVPWWPSFYFASAVADIKFNPYDPSEVWLCDWYGVWRTTDVNKSGGQIWKNDVSGMEEAVALTLTCPTEGAPLIAGVGDNSGMTFSDIHTYPQKIFYDPWMQYTPGLDFCENDPNFIVRASSNWESGSGAYSTDNGDTWREFGNYPKNADGVKLPNGKIAVAADKNAQDKLNIVALPVGSAPWHSDNLGGTWTKSAGLPDSAYVSSVWSWNHPLASDKVNPNRFYIYHHANGRVYYSSDGGKTFRQGASLPGEWYHNLKCAPNAEGEVWVSLNYKGLYRSSDGGVTFAKMPGVDRAYLLAFGKEAADPGTPAAYVYGTVNGTDGIFCSVDMGASWYRVNNDNLPIGDEPNCMEGSRQEFGTVYIGTNGRGYYYGKINAEQTQPPQYRDLSVTRDGGTLYVNGKINTFISGVPNGFAGLAVYAENGKLLSFGGFQPIAVRPNAPLSLSVPAPEEAEYSVKLLLFSDAETLAPLCIPAVFDDSEVLG